MMRIARLLLVVGVMLAVAAAPGWAQTQMPPAPAAPANATPASLEGTVKKVDQNAKTVLVSSGLFGLFGRTLEVTGDTQIQVEGRQATLMDIQEGAKVKASYEWRGGKKIATWLDVTPAPQPAKSPAAPAAPKPPAESQPAAPTK